VHEVKHDGYRLMVRRSDDRVRLFTRRGYDWTERNPRIAKAMAETPRASCSSCGCRRASRNDAFGRIASTAWNHGRTMTR
jgi:hypothetical protein